MIEHIGAALDVCYCIRLWDGSFVRLGADPNPERFVAINDAGAIGALLRWPTLENALVSYATGRISVHGEDLVSLGERTGVHLGVEKQLKQRLRQLGGWRLLRLLVSSLLTPSAPAGELRPGGHEGPPPASPSEFIQFHYDIGNAFYRLFLDERMQYSCGYFTDWSNSLDQAQHDKLDMLCRKLRLKPGERLLDVGCGWGGLICHAAEHYGVHAHGVTLSKEQAELARDKVQRLGLADRVQVDLRNYESLDGTYDKIASIGMYEHVGIANYRAYFRKLRSLLPDRGLLLNHGITRRAKRKKSTFSRLAPGRRLILKYVFPGSELDHIGHTVEAMEACGFEIHDVEGLREHYRVTARHWCQRLTANAEAAIPLVGPERYRLWLAYLAGVSLGFANGSLRLYQVVASKQSKKGPSDMPPTRADLYRD